MITKAFAAVMLNTVIYLKHKVKTSTDCFTSADHQEVSYSNRVVLSTVI